MTLKLMPIMPNLVIKSNWILDVRQFQKRLTIGIFYGLYNNVNGRILTGKGLKKYHQNQGEGVTFY